MAKFGVGCVCVLHKCKSKVLARFAVVIMALSNCTWLIVKRLICLQLLSSVRNNLSVTLSVERLYI